MEKSISQLPAESFLIKDDSLSFLLSILCTRNMRDLILCGLRKAKRMTI